ncbi:hypothetical protein [[Mycoplasma] collis]|uniref:hypothetical protein n=1 Tax=[Mycoplasma] collis TaxID=2127 RepID=UPI00051B2F6F|nr:hypothetical protein [[Mycoplasma] collis]
METTSKNETFSNANLEDNVVVTEVYSRKARTPRIRRNRWIFGIFLSTIIVGLAAGSSYLIYHLVQQNIERKKLKEEQEEKRNLPKEQTTENQK